MASIDFTGGGSNASEQLGTQIQDLVAPGSRNLLDDLVPTGREADTTTGRPGSLLLRMPAHLFVTQTQGGGGRRLRAALRIVDVIDTKPEEKAEVARLRSRPDQADDLIYMVRGGHEAEDAAAIDKAVDARFDRDPAMLPIPMMKTGGEIVNRVEFFHTGYIVETVAIVTDDLLKGGNS